jgi:hypothetical protein
MADDSSPPPPSRFAPRTNPVTPFALVSSRPPRSLCPTPCVEPGSDSVRPLRRRVRHPPARVRRDLGRRRPARSEEGE